MRDVMPQLPDDAEPKPVINTGKVEIERPNTLRQFKDQYILPYTRKIGNKFHLEKPCFARDDLSGNWYIRVPLWLQSTFLIFSIGFLSILILTIVSALQVWTYTERLMQNRLSSLAGMAAIEVEQNFHSLERSIAGAPSSNNVIQLLQSSNDGTFDPRSMLKFHREIDIQLAFSDCVAMVVYDGSLSPIYSYRTRTSSSRVRGQQSNTSPSTLLPLSNPSIRDNMLRSIDIIQSGVLGNATITEVDPITRSIDITYSVSMGISSFPELNNFEYTGQSWDMRNRTTNPNWIGYCTFVLKSTISSSAVNENFFPNLNLEMVRLNDINLQSTYEQSIKNGNFTFLLPFYFENGSISDELTWPISDFPVIMNGINLVNRTPRSNLSSVSSTEQERFIDSFQSPPIEKRKTTRTGLDTRKVNVNSSSPSNSVNLHNSTGPGSSIINNGQGNTSSLTNKTKTTETVGFKTDFAEMRTKTPFNVRSSVGYSFANVYDQKWLIFVQIPESEAFVDANKLRSVVIGAGCGILGAVFLILMPLSRWQTKGFYVIYENMKLRPLFYYDEQRHDGDLEEGVEKYELLDDSSPDQSNTSRQYSNDTGRVSLDGMVTRARHESPTSQLREQKTNVRNSPTSSSDNDFAIHHKILQTPSGEGYFDEQHKKKTQLRLSQTEERCKLNIPKPLPPLNRWYTDEVDDLIREYNTMTEKLNGHYLHLEDQVRLRTCEAQKARELREKANIAKSEFIAIISHELRTPLNGIMGLTAVSVDEIDIIKIRSALRIIIESGHILMDLLNELLELSKSLVGVDTVLSDFTPSEFLETLLNLFTSRSVSLNCTFSLAAVPHSISELTLRGDIDHIAQICLNFMSNAMKFSERNGNVSVMLHLRPLNDPLINLKPYGNQLDRANGILEIIVTDSGVGISKEQLARIFDLFVQGEDPLRKNRKGAGLGMALSKQLAEGIGGYVAVFSAKDVGTSTLIRVPIEIKGCSILEVASLNGPPIEFKVKDVYSTISLHPGEVSQVRQVNTPPLSPITSINSEGTKNNYPTPNSSKELPSDHHKARHSYTSSVGSRMLLSRSHHPVSKLLRAHSLHHHNRSEQSSKSRGSQASGSTNEDIKTLQTSNTVTGPTVIGGVQNSVIPAVTGTETNASATSLIANRPELLLDSTNYTSAGSSLRSVYTDAPDYMDTIHVAEDVVTKSSPVDTAAVKKGFRRSSTRRRPANLVIPKHQLSSNLYGKGESLTPEGLSLTVSSTKPQHVSSQDKFDSQNGFNTNARILLAEDNKLNQEIMIKMLKHMDVYNIEVADDGETVINLVEKSIVGGLHYDIIFMDLSMPGTNGITATQFIRTTLGYPYTIIALTGFSDVRTRNACHSVNIQEVLTKPVMKFDIQRVLRKYAPLNTTILPASAKIDIGFDQLRDFPDMDSTHTSRSL